MHRYSCPHPACLELRLAVLAIWCFLHTNIFDRALRISNVTHLHSLTVPCVANSLRSSCTKHTTLVMQDLAVVNTRMIACSALHNVKFSMLYEAMTL
jgi:hypothetical protein